MEFEEITTKRLRLKKFTADDFKYIFAHYSDEEIKQLLGLTTDAELLTEREKSNGGYVTYDRSIIQFKMIIIETNEVIGTCGFHNWYAVHQKAELGYALTKEENKRKGYMSEAVDSILDYGFGTLKLNRIEACIGPGNIASLSLISKFGFTQEGLLRQHYFRDGAIHDSFIFSLLKAEYKGKIKKE